MAISEGEISRAPEVTAEQVDSILGLPNAKIRANADAMLVAESVKAAVFRVDGAIYAPYDTKLE